MLSNAPDRLLETGKTGAHVAAAPNNSQAPSQQSLRWACQDQLTAANDAINSFITLITDSNAQLGGILNADNERQRRKVSLTIVSATNLIASANSAAQAIERFTEAMLQAASNGTQPGPRLEELARCSQLLEKANNFVALTLQRTDLLVRPLLAGRDKRVEVKGGSEELVSTLHQLNSKMHRCITTMGECNAQFQSTNGAVKQLGLSKISEALNKMTPRNFNAGTLSAMLHCHGLVSLTSIDTTSGLRLTYQEANGETQSVTSQAMRKWVWNSTSYLTNLLGIGLTYASLAGWLGSGVVGITAGIVLGFIPWALQNRTNHALGMKFQEKFTRQFDQALNIATSGPALLLNALGIGCTMQKLSYQTRRLGLGGFFTSFLMACKFDPFEATVAPAMKSFRIALDDFGRLNSDRTNPTDKQSIRDNFDQSMTVISQPVRFKEKGEDKSAPRLEIMLQEWKLFYLENTKLLLFTGACTAAVPLLKTAGLLKYGLKAALNPREFLGW